MSTQRLDAQISQRQNDHDRSIGT
ncbi:hypothetical protein CTAM01_17246 [Colletotrichum tamarilloi]|uniref:Uncharacterized protein n=1 Tax=Colletotrichum tamarilloi TaxID=1209934 RepID=A0ABQ9QGL9_9PEZI|nr:hypothetical protein CTAM01_17246 [Colletotrichum tamarilloi]